MNVALLLLGAATAVRDDAAVAARGETFAEHAASRAAVQHERCGGWVARRAARGREKAPVVYERAPTGLADAPSGEELAISWRRTSRRRETRAVERLATVRTAQVFSALLTAYWAAALAGRPGGKRKAPFSGAVLRPGFDRFSRSRPPH